MRGSDPEPAQPLGRKIEPPKPAVVPTVPVWRPMPAHTGYETDGSSVRRVMK